MVMLSCGRPTSPTLNPRCSVQIMTRVSDRLLLRTRTSAKNDQQSQRPRNILALLGWLTGMTGSEDAPPAPSTNWVDTCVPDKSIGESVFSSYFQAAAGFRQENLSSPPQPPSGVSLFSAAAIDPTPWMEALEIGKPNADPRIKDSLRSELVRHSRERSAEPFTSGQSNRQGVPSPAAS